jgi:hypothetical protein
MYLKAQQLYLSFDSITTTRQRCEPPVVDVQLDHCYTTVLPAISSTNTPPASIIAPYSPALLPRHAPNGNMQAIELNRGRATLFFRRNSKAILVTFLIFVVTVFITTSTSGSGSQTLRGSLQSIASGGGAFMQWGGAVRQGTFSVEGSRIGEREFHIAAIADLDQKSRVEGDAKGS